MGMGMQWNVVPSSSPRKGTVKCLMITLITIYSQTAEGFLIYFQKTLFVAFNSISITNIDNGGGGGDFLVSKWPSH